MYEKNVNVVAAQNGFLTKGGLPVTKEAFDVTKEKK